MYEQLELLGLSKTINIKFDLSDAIACLTPES